MTLTALSCAHDAERALLTQFFAASRLRDLTALQKIATVVFEPATDGIVTSFEILRMTAVPGPTACPSRKTISISAPVRLPDGRTVTKTVVVTMERRRGRRRSGSVARLDDHGASAPARHLLQRRGHNHPLAVQSREADARVARIDRRVTALAVEARHLHREIGVRRVLGLDEDLHIGEVHVAATAVAASIRRRRPWRRRAT